MAALIYAAQRDDCPYTVAMVSGDKPDADGFAMAEAEGVATVRLDARTLGDAYWRELDAALDGVDLIALAGFMRIVPPWLVEKWAGRMVNIHPSLLPAHPGLHTHDAVLDAGEPVTGATVHLVSEGVDEGEILGQVRVAVLPGDDRDRLAERVRIAEHQLYPRVVAEYAARPFDAGWIERRVDDLARALPEVFRKASHGSPGWGVGSEKSGKLFAIIADRHHGEDAIGLLVKASGPDEMSGLIEAQPDIYYWPKYYGASGWLGLKLNRRDVDWDQVRDWLERSWRSAAPPRLTKLIRAAEEF